jgi:phosphatidylglycerol:prolipoprotein diacylglycerol transferase
MAEFLYWWQHLPAHMDPVILEIGSFKLQYYGLMYIVAFAITYLLAELSHPAGRPIRPRHRTAPGAHDGHDPRADCRRPLGLCAASTTSRTTCTIRWRSSCPSNFPAVSISPASPACPITAGSSVWWWRRPFLCAKTVWIFSAWPISSYRASRWDIRSGGLGNFINGELYGRVTTHPIGMYFPFAPGPGRRHPVTVVRSFFRRHRSVHCPVGGQKPGHHPGRHAGHLSHGIRPGALFHRVCAPARRPPGFRPFFTLHGPAAVHGHDAGWWSVAALSEKAIPHSSRRENLTRIRDLGLATHFAFYDCISQSVRSEMVDCGSDQGCS